MSPGRSPLAAAEISVGRRVVGPSLWPGSPEGIHTTPPEKGRDKATSHALELVECFHNAVFRLSVTTWCNYAIITLQLSATPVPVEKRVADPHALERVLCCSYQSLQI